jgi:cytochrome P450
MPDYVARRPEDRDPKQYTDQIRALTAEVWRRVQEWHDKPDWVDDERNRHRYQLIAKAVAQLDALPDPERVDGVAAIIDAIKPISAEWRPHYAGPEQSIYAAVDRLRNVISP